MPSVRACEKKPATRFSIPDHRAGKNGTRNAALFNLYGRVGLF